MYHVEKDIAAYIKKEFDKKYNPTWHCIVGRNFGETQFQTLLVSLVLNIKSSRPSNQRAATVNPFVHTLFHKTFT